MFRYTYFGVSFDFLLGATPEAYLLWTEYQISETEKALSKETDEEKRGELEAKLEALKESLEDQQMFSSNPTKKAPPAGEGEGRYGLQKRDWWGIGQWFKHELDVIARPPEYLANKSGIPLDRVEAFLVGNAELSKAELESFAKVIGKPLGEIIHGYAAAFEKEDDPVDLAAYLQVFGSLSSEEQMDLVQIAVLSGKIGPAAAKGISTLRALLESQMPPSQD